MDGVKKWIEMGNEILVSLNKARTHMMATVDDLVEEGTLSRPQGEAILEAWKRRVSGESVTETEDAREDATDSVSNSPELAALWDKWLQMTPVRREELEELRVRLERIEKQILQRSGE